MRTWLLALLLAAPALAGCIGDGDPLDDSSVADTLLGTDQAVVQFDATGELLPLDEVVGAAEYLLSGHRGAEPNMGITSDGSIFASAGDTVIRSRDGGASWEVVYDLFAVDDGILPNMERGALRNSDPMLWVDPVTDRVFNSPMFPALACTWLAWSDDAGDSWTERPMVCHPPAMDHQKIFSGVPGPDAPPMAGSAYPTVVYQCYNELFATTCGVSFTGGFDWAFHQVAADFATDGCGGINGHGAVSDQGIVALPLALSCDKPAVVISTDSGLTWTLRKVEAATYSGSIDPEVSFAPDGTLYFQYRSEEDLLTYLVRSEDNGETWSDPMLVTPPGVQATVFHVLHAGADGKVAMAFLGTRDEVDDPSEAPDETRWHLYIVTSEDATMETPVFTGRQVTPDEDPVQVGCVWLGGGGNPCRNMLDFIDGAVAPDGTFHVVYTEGCTDDCAGNPDATPDDSRDRQVALGKLTGWSLLG